MDPNFSHTYTYSFVQLLNGHLLSPYYVLGVPHIGEDEPGPPPGVTARVEKGFFEDSLVRCQEEGVHEAELPAPQARALPGRKIKIRRIILSDCHGEC